LNRSVVPQGAPSSMFLCIQSVNYLSITEYTSVRILCLSYLQSESEKTSKLHFGLFLVPQGGGGVLLFASWISHSFPPWNFFYSNSFSWCEFRLSTGTKMGHLQSYEPNAMLLLFPFRHIQKWLKSGETEWQVAWRTHTGGRRISCRRHQIRLRDNPLLTFSSPTTWLGDFAFLKLCKLAPNPSHGGVSIMIVSISLSMGKLGVRYWYMICSSIDTIFGIYCNHPNG